MRLKLAHSNLPTEILRNAVCPCLIYHTTPTRDQGNHINRSTILLHFPSNGGSLRMLISQSIVRLVIPSSLSLQSLQIPPLPGQLFRQPVNLSIIPRTGFDTLIARSLEFRNR